MSVLAALAKVGLGVARSAMMYQAQNGGGSGQSANGKEACTPCEARSYVQGLKNWAVKGG